MHICAVRATSNRRKKFRKDDSVFDQKGNSSINGLAVKGEKELLKYQEQV